VAIVVAVIALLGIGYLGYYYWKKRKDGQNNNENNEQLQEPLIQQ
jgi:cbb3-type cytochrome oxidase subunit 3